MKKFTHPFMHLLVLAMMSLVIMFLSLMMGVAVGVSDNDPTTFLLWNTFVQLLSFALPMVVMTRMYYGGEQREFYQLDFSGRKWLFALAGVAVFLLLVPLTDWLATWNNSWHWSGVWEKVEESLRHAGEQSQQLVERFLKECHPALNLFGLALVPALCEELFFRAGIQNLLLRWFSRSSSLNAHRSSLITHRSSLITHRSSLITHFAVWVTAAVFSLAHGEVFAFLPRFVLGVLLGYLYVYGRSLLINVTVHFINNAIIVVAYGLMVGGATEFDPSDPLALSPVLTVGCTLAAVALFYVVFLRRTSGTESRHQCKSRS